MANRRNDDVGDDDDGDDDVDNDDEHCVMNN